MLLHSVVSVASLVAIFSATTSAFANPIIYENPKGAGGYSITQTYLNFDNYGFMEGGVPMDCWKISNDSSTSHTLTFSVDTAGASGGFVLYDTTYSGTSTYVFGTSGITPGAHTYTVTLTAGHQYTMYVQPTGSTTYNYHFTWS
ncbi:hypothetical protein B5M42_022995 [Paenibacillus athensensis]|uniref:Uncharacterized protein n=2 Tax=Paenibacillus athensensis TaxID=1967502 RepID=A0A4Y8PRD7_9BACL|nr:hypothetical protein [Paenibacillus athensensis]